MPLQDTPLSNYLTRPDLLPGSTEAVGGEENADLENKRKSNRTMFDADDLADLRGATSALVAGDLVETR